MDMSEWRHEMTHTSLILWHQEGVSVSVQVEMGRGAAINAWQSLNYIFQCRPFLKELSTPLKNLFLVYFSPQKLFHRYITQHYQPFGHDASQAGSEGQKPFPAYCKTFSAQASGLGLGRKMMPSSIANGKPSSRCQLNTGNVHCCIVIVASRLIIVFPHSL